MSHCGQYQCEVLDEDTKEKINKIYATTNLERKPFPKEPILNDKVSIKVNLGMVQSYLEALEYNHTGTTYFNVTKNRSFKRIAETAKDIIKESLPIQCLEAVFLSAYLTCGITKLQRLPVSFKTIANGQFYRHIVLAIRYQNKWGTVGLSRRDCLSYKEIEFKSLSALIEEFQTCYSSISHELKKIYIGFPFTHNMHSGIPVEWRILNLKYNQDQWSDIKLQIDYFARDAENLNRHFETTHCLPDNFSSIYTLNCQGKFHKQKVKSGKPIKALQKCKKSDSQITNLQDATSSLH